jgi:hypothetical protein
MKKLAFILAIALTGSVAVSAANSIQPTASAVNAIQYCKIFNDTASPFDYKVGTDVFTITIGTSAAMAYEENTQILKKDTNGNWVNWFVFSSAYANQTVQLSTLLSI